ncbi:MAG: hypothetical protein E4G95_02120 [Bacteroidia bacterium]|nr:MAG: hypothetical protein E4G95_02120 [Bacteroidia bacterium]
MKIKELLISMNTNRIIIRLTLLLILFPVKSAVSFSQETAVTKGPLTMETVILRTDRSIYLPGEEILLTAEIVEADNYRVSFLSRVLRVEILDNSGTAITREKYELSGGRIVRSVKLPLNLPSGWYQVRAYTNWMRNFRRISYPSVNLRIIDPADPGNIIVADRPDTLLVSLLAPGRGQLVAGLKNSCAVRVTDIYGNPQPLRGALLKANNDTVSYFTSGMTGWGSVKFNPAPGTTYRFVSLEPEARVVISKLPLVEASGSTLNLEHGQGSINVQFSQKGDATGGRARLIVHSLYNWYWYITGEIKGGEAIFTVPYSSLPSAIVQFTVLDERANILATSLFAPQGLVSQEGEITIDVPPGEPGTMVTAGYSVDNGGSEGNYNLVIRKKEPVETWSLYIPGLPGWPAVNSIPLNADERNAWLAGNSYEGSVVSSFFGDPAGEPVERQVSFSELTSSRENGVDFLPETRGLSINGMIREKGTGNPVRGEIISLTAFSDNFLYTSTTFGSGRFHFTLPGRRNEDELILSYTSAPMDDWELTLFPDFDSLDATLPPRQVSVTMAELEYIRGISVDIQLDAIYDTTGRDTIAPIDTTATNSRMFYGYPDNVVLVDEFIRLPNMREVIFEVVPSVITRKEDNRWIIKVTNQQPFPAIYHPLILLDGIPLLEFDQFLDLPPERIKKIEIINSLYIHGNVIFAGLVNFVSLNGDLAGLSLPAESQIISMQMPLRSGNIEVDPVTRESPNLPLLSGKLKVLPFIREGMGSVSFSTTSNLGDYIMIINGFTGSQKWVSATRSFEIKGTYPGK